ncbi:MAG: hypothetical protein QOJ29_4666, partial [Thermoleophilaceae bacterium]|nr:hypothetical protein [Thermoleophilaceae bacterium]
GEHVPRTSACQTFVPGDVGLPLFVLSGSHSGRVRTEEDHPP